MTIKSPYKLEKLEIKGKPAGIVRISKNVKIALILAFTLIIAIFAYGITKVHQKHEAVVSKAEHTKLEAASEIAKVFNKDIPNNIYMPSVRTEEVQSQYNNLLDKVSKSVVNNAHSDVKVEATREKELLTKLKEKKQEKQLEDELKARSAATSYEQFSMHSRVNDKLPTQIPFNSNISNTETNNTQKIEDQNAKDDPGQQFRKERFLKEAANSNEDHYLNAVQKEPLSHYEVKAGNIIPAIMIGGINSDLPGQIIAQVRENVYDTARGEFLLIPQGTKLIGFYDSQIAYGQERVLIAWHRLIFPGGSSMDLKAMPGSDLAGYAGFKDQIDNHYFRTFGSSILMSLIGAGAMMTQPEVTTSNNTSMTPGQIMASTLGASLSATANNMLQKNLNIQPTLEIRPGYKFNVMVTKDMVFPGSY